MALKGSEGREGDSAAASLPVVPLAYRVAIALRWLLVPGILGAAVTARLLLPQPDTSGHGGLLGAIPEDLPAIEAQREAADHFLLPFISRTSLVLRFDQVLTAAEEEELISTAIRQSQELLPSDMAFFVALPVIGAIEDEFSEVGGAVLVVHLFYPPESSVGDRLRLAHTYRELMVQQTGADFGGITGALPSSEEQALLIRDSIGKIELATLAVVLAIVVLRFQALGAAVVTLFTIGSAYLLSNAAIAVLSERLDFPIPVEVRPLLTVLLFGIVTDYTVFYFSDFERRAVSGEGSAPEAARRTSAAVTPTIITAAVIVAVGTAGLLFARIDLLAQLVPSLVIAIGMSMLVVTLFVPGLLAMGGRALLWPTRTRQARLPLGFRVQMQQWITRPVFSILGAILAVGLLVAAALPLREAHVGTNLLADLPQGQQATEAADEAARSFPAGILGPTEVVLYDEDIVHKRESLVRLQEVIEARERVAMVVGPEQQLLPLNLGLIFGEGGNAVRYLILWDTSPYGAEAINAYRDLERDLPLLVEALQLGEPRIGFGGDTPVSAQVSDIAVGDTIRISAVILLIQFGILFIYLRAVLASILVIATSILVVLASLGTVALISPPLLGVEEITFFVPIAVSVLLLSLDSDYNLFLLGQIWEEKRGTPFRSAVVLAGSRASSAILTAGLALAFSFLLMGLIPVASFRQFALAMFIGILADTFIVRPVLLPALLSLAGRFATWPSSPSPQTQLDTIQ